MTYAYDDALWIDTIDRVYAEIIRKTSIEQDRTQLVIELGCGTGDHLVQWHRMLSDERVQFIGIDHSEAMLERAREKGPLLPSERVELLRGDMRDFADLLLQGRLADCILVTAGTFHHLVSDEDRENFLQQIQRSLRPETGLCAVYLLPDNMIHADETSSPSDSGPMQMLATNNQQLNDQDWLCQQIFALHGPSKVNLSWQLRTCKASKLIDLFHSHQFQTMFCSINGRDLLHYDHSCPLPSTNDSTPILIVVRSVKSSN
jgi:ubiquinone/menaquinone biosynthesis C-methylase UbiE